MQPPANRSRTLAMSIRGVSTGTPTASTLTDRLADERQQQVEVVDHQVEHDVDVEAALGERAEPVHLDEARLRAAARAPPSTAGLKRSVWPTARRTPRAAAAAIRRSASATVRAIGFSTSTCTPRSRNGSATVEMRLRSARRSSRHRRVRPSAPRVGERRRCPTRRRSPAPAPRCVSTTPTSCTPGIVAEEPGVVPAEVADADDGRRAAVALITLLLAGGPADDGDAGGVGGRDHRRRRTSASCRRRPTARVAPARAIAWIVGTPTTGTSKRMSCFGLATFTTRTPGPARSPARAITASVPSIASTATTARVLHGDRLADVEAGDRVGHPVAEREDRAPRRRSARVPSARRRRRAAACRSAVESISSMPCSRITSATAAMSASVFVDRERASARQQRQVGHDAGEDLRVLDLPGHHGVGRRRRPAGSARHVPELAERDPVDGGAAAPRAAASRSGDGLFLDGDDVTSWPSAARGVEHEEREAAVAGDQAELHASSRESPASSARLVGRWSVTPRGDDRMKSTR